MPAHSMDTRSFPLHMSSRERLPWNCCREKTLVRLVSDSREEIEQRLIPLP